jgi:hypothetical protein
MGTLLQLSASRRKASSQPRGDRQDCEIVIFPGVRIERHDLDLSHRVRKAVDGEDFSGAGVSPGRPRKTS